MSKYWNFIVLGSWLISAGRVEAAAVGVAQSRHNLSAGGFGTAKAASVGSTANSEICIFCHTPHTGGAKALWNRNESTVTYTPYKSSTLKARVGQPTGASKMCLSCHDGTVALGKIRSRPEIPMKTAAATIPAGPSNLETDLSDDHPVSFKYDASLTAANGQLNSPSSSSRVHLDANGEVQCTSCHDAHSGENPKFLVMNNTASALCLTCHNLTPWNQSSHRLSAKTWNGNAPNPWPHTSDKSVAANACENCHNPHGAGGRQRLMNFAAEEQNCYTCHNGNVAAKNVEADFSKLSTHPVKASQGIHDPMELGVVPNSSRHVECEDCHNPHAANSSGPGSLGAIPGALAGVRGVNAAGANVSQITYEYELCFRCHAESAKGPSKVNRQFPQLNTRQEFQPGGATNSFHPVVTVGRNPNVPSLKAPLTSASRIGCGDCHNSDSGSRTGGVGPNGPHGSAYAPLLERSLSYADAGATPANSGLCFKCHNYANTAWSGHVQHIGMTSCMTCHDPHGAPNAHLINFNPTVVGGARSYRSTGLNRGNCTLSCHGKEHNSSY